MAKYKTTIGLEIHAELKTNTKMFCGCKNDPLEKIPNKNICPICLAHPGTLPTINKRAVELLVAIGQALGGEISGKAHFDRKSYFYPDLPKGYQISQYEEPFVKGGNLVGVEITRVHLEEDTARLAHDKSGSQIDFNRAGLPLMELVTEPVIETADKALEFAKEFQLILRYLGASDADMEKGQMRVEANVSVAKDGAKELGTKVELKNINSFKAVASAIGYEVKRQINVLDGGGKVVQETRGWDDKKSETFSQRLKEEANDYRYMPEPDLPPVDFDVSEGIDLEKIRISVPELPADKRQRFVKEFGMRGDQVEVLVSNMRLSEYFEEVYSELSTMERVTEKSTQLLVNYLTSDLMGLLNEKRTAIEGLKIKAEDMAELVALIEDGEVSSRVAKDILRAMFETGVDPHSFIKDKSLGRIEDDSEVIEAVKKTISENKKAVEDYKNGKGTAVKFLIGQAMGKLRGRGNPELLEKLFLEYLAK
ncbi:MAG: glutaminyl-tRNA synthase (glutamine-hydrolyzing) subunit B [Candidatus Colwellbacteria bacterium RIFCSPLOWO2_02_FULL_45_11]|uniref:Aspartyl/glutamyl-tRNA(Asn/Gln) amidotransferase subunit B n=3 Tax=Parcubacteria group TaxID=1794811 RepID=A0A0H4T410_9BACT|nr:aspartyl/glutamyl-tRNA(Asn/Gln) amidotransferase subunit B, aspartyl-tRNA(Asn)/glutamyl-tRNA (Gln) amidotransferase subunit B [uncultured Parcubacteria bacterium Rifle_16ft_4_minimus_37647]OGY60484.1 MAG: glutaminyl-tRNA synthase (glutamine-hydrolyzing) subunit B [Candidatus Colwellbacteria bacterium RIFCSPLOWO2_02_FULL_45_11]